MVWFLSCGSPTAGQSPSSLLTVEVKDRSARKTDGSRSFVLAGPIVVEHEVTGQTWTQTECVGWCAFDALGPGRYRVTVELGRGERSVVSGVPVEEGRQTYVRVDFTDGGRDVDAAAVRRPIAEANPEGTFVAVLGPNDLRGPFVDTCDPARIAELIRWLEATQFGTLRLQRRQLVTRTGQTIEVWGDLRKWWGGIRGRMTNPDGQALGGIPVHIEPLDDDDAPDADSPLHLSSKVEGCFGAYGMWPGRYRLFVDDPPFSVIREMAVSSERMIEQLPASDIPVEVVPRQRAVPEGSAIHSKRFGRVSSVQELARLVTGRAVDAGAKDMSDPRARDLAWVNGAVTWWSEPSDWRQLRRLPDVTVRYRHEASDELWEAVTGDDGRYRLELPEGTYQVTVDHDSLLPLRARVLVTREGHAVLRGFQDPAGKQSGVSVPGATFRSGLMASVHLALVMPVSGRTASDAASVTVPGRAPSPVASPLSVEFAREGGPEESLWTTPLTHHAGSGRTIQSFHPLTPGIVYTEHSGSLAQFTATGQRRFANRLTIDGISADLGLDVGGAGGIGEAGSGALPALGTTGSTQTLVPIDAIERVGIHTANATSELARSPGAQTTIVTRAGADRFSGSLFADVRPEGLSANDFFDNANGVRRSRQFAGSGLSLGGPLGLPRTNYWATYERQDIDRSMVMTHAVPSLAVREAAPAALRPLLDAFPVPNGPLLSEDFAGPGLAEYSGMVPVESRLSVLSARVDANAGGRHRGFVRVNHGRSDGEAVSVFRQSPFFVDNSEATTTTSTTLGVTSMGSTFFHDLRVNATSHSGSLVAGTPSYGGAQPPAPGALPHSGAQADDTWVRFTLFDGSSGFLIFGRTGSASQQQWQLVDTSTFLLGRHEWRVGFDYRQVTAETSHAQDRYTYRFDNLAAVLPGRVRFVSVDHFGNARVRLRNFSAFVQDDFRVSPRLSLHYGLRYGVKPAPASLTDEHPLLFEFEALPDFQPRPTGVRLWNTSRTDLAPRVAASYVFGEAGRETTVRAGWSLTFDELTSPGATAFGQGYPYRSRRIIRPSTFPVPAAELAVSPPVSFSESPFAEAYAFPANLCSPRTHQWHIGADRVLGQHQRIAMAYIGAAGRRLPYWHAYFVDATQSHTVHAFSDASSSDYHALLTEYTYRASPLRIRIAHTWSHAIDTDSGESEWPNLPPSVSPVSANRASADFDRRHVLYAAASLQLPTPRLGKGFSALLSGWSVDVGTMAQSGAPVTILGERRDIGRGFEILRPDAVPDAPVWIDDPSSPTGRRINAAAFSIPTEPRQGNLGRNTVRSTPLRQVDLSLGRSLRLGRSTVAQVRLHVFNVLNVTNFGPLSGDLEGQLRPFGAPYESYAHALGTGTLLRGGLAPMQQAGGARHIQLSVNLGWGAVRD